MNNQQKIEIIIDIEKRMNDNLKENDFYNLIDYIILNYYISFIDNPLVNQSFYKNNSIKYFNYIIENLKKFSILPGSLYGFSTLLYIANTLNDNSIYDSIIDKISLFLSEHYHNFYLKKLYSSGLKSSIYDLLNGLSGVGITLLDNTNNYNLIKEIAIDLINLYKETNFIIQKENTTNPYFYYNFNNGYIDLGMSHGLIAILVFFSKIKKNNIKVPNLDNIINNISQIYINFINNNSIQNKEFPLLPQCLVVNEKGNLDPFYDKRMSWCYGTLIIMKKLFEITDQLLDDPNQCSKLKNNISHQINSILKCDLLDLDLICPTFCHGLSGLFHITNEMNVNNNIYNLNLNNIEYLKKKIETTIWKNIENSQYKFYFAKIEYSKISKKYTIDENNTGYLSGAVSIIIPYICSISNIPSEKNIFDKILLI